MKPVTFTIFPATRAVGCISSKSESDGAVSMRGIWISGAAAKANDAVATMMTANHGFDRNFPVTFKASSILAVVCAGATLATDEYDPVPKLHNTRLTFETQKCWTTSASDFSITQGKSLGA